MKKVCLVIIGMLLLAGCASRMAVKKDYDFSKVRRIAVLDFEGEGSSGVVDMFILDLMRSGFDVVERSRISSVLREQELGGAGRLDPATVKNIGKVLGVDVLLAGSVSQFVPAQKRTIYFALGDTPVIIPGLYVVDKGDNYIVYATDAEIGIGARLIDVETGSVVWAASDSYRGLSTDTALQGAVVSLVDALKSVFPKEKNN